MNRSKIIRSKAFEHEVECQICGFKSLTNIQNHIRFKHPEISIKEYMEKYDAEIMTEDAKKARAAKCLGKNKGRVQTEEEKAVRSEKNKKFYEDHPEKREIVAKRQKEIYEAGNHPLFREDVRQKRRDRMSEMNKSEEHRALVGNHMRNIYVCSEKTKALMKIKFKGRVHSAKTREKISLTKKAKFADGFYTSCGKIKGYFLSEKMKKELPYKSKFELIYYMFLEEDISIKTYEVEKIRIPYLLNGEKHTYFPDVLVDDRILVEINSKMVWYLNRVKKEAKAQAAREYCKKMGWEYKIIYEDDLGIEIKNYPDYIKNFNFPRE